MEPAHHHARLLQVLLVRAPGEWGPETLVCGVDLQSVRGEGVGEAQTDGCLLPGARGAWEGRGKEGKARGLGAGAGRLMCSDSTYYWPTAGAGYVCVRPTFASC